MDNKVVETRRIVESTAVAGLLQQRKQERLERTAGKKRRRPFGKDSSYVSFDEQESSEFDEIESYFQFVSTAVENSPNARPSKIKALKDIQKNTRNINDIYPAKSLADKKSLRKMLFIDSNVFQDS
jgi:hypothetical protein